MSLLLPFTVALEEFASPDLPPRIRWDFYVEHPTTGQRQRVSSEAVEEKAWN